MANASYVDFASMQKGIGVVGEALTNIGTIGKSMQATVDSVSGAWTGQAASVFNSALTQWEQQLATITTNLGQIVESLGGNQKQYVQNEQSNADMSKGVANMFADLGVAGGPGLK